MYHGMRYIKVNGTLFYHDLTDMIYQGYMPFRNVFCVFKIIILQRIYNIIDPKHIP